MLQRPERRQKHQAPYEVGWRVAEVLSASTVVIAKPGSAKKVVNVASIKPTPANHPEAEDDDSSEELGIQFAIDNQPERSHGYNLRGHSTLRRPDRFSQ